jgi:hypothetical protein
MRSNRPPRRASIWASSPSAPGHRHLRTRHRWPPADATTSARNRQLGRELVKLGQQGLPCNAIEHRPVLLPEPPVRFQVAGPFRALAAGLRRGLGLLIPFGARIVCTTVAIPRRGHRHPVAALSDAVGSFITESMYSSGVSSVARATLRCRLRVGRFMVSLPSGVFFLWENPRARSAGPSSP